MDAEMKRFAGFTLIELMIVVAVVGILAAIAYPSYLDYVRKSRRADAMSGLLQVQVQQEKYRANNTTYAAALTTLGYTADTSASPDSIYNLNVVSASATSYVVRAVPQGDQANDTCGTFAIGPDGPDTTAGYANADCWER